jgi:hypothetical protein
VRRGLPYLTGPASQSLHETMAELVPERIEYAKKLRADYGDKSLGEVRRCVRLGLKVPLMRRSRADQGRKCLWCGGPRAGPEARV